MSVSEATPLESLPVLAGLAAEHRDLVLAAFVSDDYDFGDSIVTQGDPSDAFYVVLEGSARAVVTTAAGEEVHLATLRAGDQFGEDGVLDGKPRGATVRASERVRVARLDAAVLRALVTVHPELDGLLERQRRVRRLRGILLGNRAFAQLPPATATELLDELDRIDVEDGEPVVSAGESSDALYLIEQGRLSVLRDGAVLRRLHEGEILGERGLLLDEPRSATVVAEGAATVLRLSRTTIERLRGEHPAFDSALRERLALYSRRDRQADAAAGRGPALPAAELGDLSSGVGVADIDSPTARPDTGGPTKKFPFVRQLDAMDCGAACVAMVCRRYGRPVSLTYIRNAVGTGFDGTTLRGIMQGAEIVGLDVWALKTSADRLDDLPLPAIVLMGGNHWVVLHEVSGDHVRVADPAIGPRPLPRAEFEAQWSGYAAPAAPTPVLELAPAATASLRWLIPHVRPYKRVLLIGLALSLVMSGLRMLMPVLSQQIVDHVIVNHDRALLHLLALGMAGVLLVSLAVSALQRRLLARAALNIDASALEFLLSRMLELPMAYFQTRRSIDIEQRLDGMREIRELLVQRGVVAVTDITQLFAALVTMALYSPLLALCFLGTIPLYGGLMLLSTKRLRPTIETMQEAQARFRGGQMDALRGVETVKTMGAEIKMRDGLVGEFRKLTGRLLKADLTLMGYGALTEFASFAVSLGFLWGGAMLVLSGSLSVGDLLLVQSLVLLASGPIVGLLGLWDEYQFSAVLLGRLQDVFDQEPEQDASKRELPRIERLDGRVTLRDVSFHYPAAPDRPVLRDIDLDVPAGSTVALVGRSGCGKSTLVKCLAGINAITGGEIAYDGTPLAGVDLTDLRRHIGFVLQHPYLFDRTIAENIAFGDDEPDLVAVRRAAEVADAHVFITGLPLGYDTMIGESGMSLSGGQSQRISIARAVYRDPPVLLLDEATSALDAETERNVKENLDGVMAGRTAFVVAHRLSTIRDADVIVVLDEGRIVESGSHETLLRRDGLYAHLLAQQLAD